jgi:GT2 family glycosyltransferase
LVGRLITPGQPSTTSVIIVTHNSEDLLPPVLDALFSNGGRPDEVIIVDSASTDGTLALLAGYPVTVLARRENVGFAAGCHIGAGAASSPTLVFLGHDTVPGEGWLAPLVAAIDDPAIGAAMATIEDAARPGTFNTSGGHLTYFGMAWVSDLGSPIPAETGLHPVAFPSGAAMAIRHSTWDRFGGFRAPFFMYEEDVDLGWRLRLAGLRLVRVPASRVAHHYDFARSPAKLYHLERNRWLMLRSNYRRRTLAVLAPALVLVEIGVTIVAWRDGWLAEKRRAWRDAARAKAVVAEGRGLAMVNRRLGDAEMIASMDCRLSGITQVRPPRGVGIIDGLLRVWQRLALPLVRLLDRFG